jgi:hypothetical protein
VGEQNTASAGMSARQEGKDLFFEKKKQKTSVRLARGDCLLRAPCAKSFCFFFFRKRRP